jgi:hypothetical protein
MLASFSLRRSLFFHWYNAPSPSPVMTVELQGQLLARERELNSREGALTTCEDGLAAFKCALGKVLTERDPGRV